MKTDKKDNRSMKIAIIGAGASGLTAAYTLKKMGYDDVQVYEKETYPGGKVYSYEHEGKFHELGAVWFADQYKTILDLAHEFEIPYFSAEAPDVIHKNHHSTYEKYIFSQYNPLRVIGSIINMWKMQRKFPELKKAGFANLHPDLHLPLTDFAEKHKITVVTEIIASFMTGCGYGYYEEVPAIYLIKLITKTINGFVRGTLSLSKTGLSSFTNGWQSLWQAVADMQDVKYNSAVTNIKRYENNGKTVVDVTAAGITETYDRVIVSAPLETAHFFMDLSDKEANLFKKINNYDYAVTLFKGDDIPNVSLIDSTTADTIGKVTFMAHHRQDTNIHSAYQLLPEGVTEEESIGIIKETVERMGGEFKELIFRKQWSYFPHVSREHLDQGYYKDLESLQGVNGTYYVGGLLNFETVEDTARYAMELVENEFGK